MVSQLLLGDIAVDVVLKDIKNVHLSVYPPTGRVRIAAPRHMSLDTIRIFAISKLGWIKKHQETLAAQERTPAREYVDRESHWVWGKRYLMTVVESDQPPSVELKHKEMVLRVRPGTDDNKRHAVIEDWSRQQIRLALPPLMARWQQVVGVTVERFYIQRMKTRWGSCNEAARTIRLNTELAKKPPECLEYILVHELVHLLERRHNERFVGLMNRFLPQWPVLRDELNRAPLAHENWRY